MIDPAINTILTSRNLNQFCSIYLLLNISIIILNHFFLFIKNELNKQKRRRNELNSDRNWVFLVYFLVNSHAVGMDTGVQTAVESI